MPQLRDVKIETFDQEKPIAERVWHVRRGPGQSMFCGLLAGRAGESARFADVGGEFICQSCASRIPVAL